MSPFEVMLIMIAFTLLLTLISCSIIKFKVELPLRKAKRYKKKVKKVLINMLKEPFNKNTLKFSYLASIKVLKDFDFKIDPVFTIVVEKVATTIRLSEIINVVLNKEETNEH